MKKEVKLAIAGIEGSFSEELALDYAKRKSFNPKFIYAVSADQCFKEIINDKADLGIIALENSNGGVVYETIYAMAKYIFKIEEIIEMDVRQNLLVLPRTKREEIKKITSHQQALAQCKIYLRRIWPIALLEEYPDTALAAKDLKEGKFPAGTAVIASRRAAAKFDLEVLESNIQDLKFNFTSFLVVKK